MSNKYVTDYESQYVPLCCPFCGNKLEWQGVDLVCTNVDCANRDEQNLKVWISNIAQIDGISEKLIFKFLEELNINSLEELYSKTYEELEYKDAPNNSHKGKFNKVLFKLFNEPINWYNALMGLNIKMLGDKTSKKLVNTELIMIIKEFLETEDISSFANEVNKKLVNVVGPAFIETLLTPDSLTKLKNLNYVKDRLYQDEVAETKKLIPVVITGKLSVPRKKFEEYLNKNGYEVKGAITKEVKYLITDNPQSGSSKNKRADELGIEKITEEQIRNIIDFDKSSVSFNDIL